LRPTSSVVAVAGHESCSLSIVTATRTPYKNNKKCTGIETTEISFPIHPAIATTQCCQ